jgi:hypothetical protein
VGDPEYTALNSVAPQSVGVTVADQIADAAGASVVDVPTATHDPVPAVRWYTVTVPPETTPATVDTVPDTVRATPTFTTPVRPDVMTVVVTSVCGKNRSHLVPV